MAIDVDVLCVGSGPGALGAAVLAARANLSVMYTEAFSERLWSDTPLETPPSWTGVLLERWGVQNLDRQTRTFLDQATADVGEPDTADPEGVGVTELEPMSWFPDPRAGAPVPPFNGARLRAWTRQCLASGAGVLSTRVTLPGAVRVRTTSGDAIEVGDIIPIPDDGLGEIDLHTWLLGRARQHGVHVMDGHGLQRLLFSENQVFGGIIDTPSGSEVVHCRHGVMLGTGSRRTGLGHRALARTADTRTRLCLSTRKASRFCRLELVPEHDPPLRPRARPTSMDLRGAGHRRMMFSGTLSRRSRA